jgi:glycosyltransferase involved in cell wall biosynthesis
MRILICNWKDLSHPAAGGAEVYTQECARRWAAWGHHVTLLCSAVPGRPDIEVVDGVRILRQGNRLGVYSAARRVIRSFGSRFDVIIDEINTRPFFAHHHAGRTPVVALVHQVAKEVWSHETPLPVALVGRYVLEPRWLPAYADVPTMTVSASSAESLARYGLRNLHLVPEGVELPAGVPDTYVKAERPTFAFCGRLVSMKRPGEAIEAFSRARRLLGPDAVLDVIGTGPLEGPLRAAAPPGVTFRGRVSQEEKYELLGRAHALVATSVREGWGLVVSEAAAVGTPAIAYDVAGLRDSVKAASGILVPESVESLAEAMSFWQPRLAAKPPAPLPHGGAHSWDHVAAEVLDTVEHLIGRRRSLAAA